MDDLLLEKMMSGLSVTTAVCEHGRACVMREKIGKESCHDFVGDRVRLILEEQVASADPFSLAREQHKFHDRPRGSPYTGLEESYVERFVDRMGGMYDQKY